MSYYPRQYPVLDRTEWAFCDFAEGEHNGTAGGKVLQLADGHNGGVYDSPVIDAGQAVAWRELVWEADVPEGSAIAFRIKSGKPEEGRRACRWSGKMTESPALIKLFGSLEGSVHVAADRYLQIRVEMKAGPNGSPKLKSFRVNCELVAPTCVGPMNHAILESNTPKFYWTRVEGAADYTFELSETPDFSRILCSRANLTDSAFTYPDQLPEGTFYWRVRSVDGAGGISQFSPTRQFTRRRPAAADYSRLRHPYLYFSGDDIPEIRKRLRGRRADTWKQILEHADKALDADLPDEKDILLKEGQHGGFYDLNTDVAHYMLIPLSFAYVITGDEKYAAKARELLLFFVGMSRWTGFEFGDASLFYPVWHATLETAMLARHVAPAYDWLYDYLSVEDRARVRAGLMRLAILPTLTSWADPETIRFCPRHQTASGNWWSVCNSGAGIAALAIINEVADAPNWVRAFANTIRDLLSYQGGDVFDVHLKAGHGGQDLLKTEPNWDTDGGYQESIGYSHFGLLYATYFLFPLKRVTGEEMTDLINPKLADFPYYFGYWGKDGKWLTIPFNDSGSGNWSDDVLALLATVGRSGRAKYLLDATWPTFDNVTAVLAEDLTIAPQLPDDTDRNKLFAGIGWSIFRSGWDKDASLLAAKFHQGRGHSDIGQYVVNYKGSEFVVDSGVIKYSDPKYGQYTRTSRGHNVILVDEQAQVRVDGRVLGCAHALCAGIVEADLTAAYQDLLESWKRTLVFLEPGFFAVIDRIVSDEERTIDWLVHPKGEISLDPNSGATFTQNDTELKLLVLSPERWTCNTFDGYVELNPVHYLGFRPNESARETLIAAVYVGGPAGQDVKVEKLVDGGPVRARIACADATYTLLIGKDGDAPVSGWGVAAQSSICAVADVGSSDAMSVNWAMAGSGPLSLGDDVLADASRKPIYRAGAR